MVLPISSGMKRVALALIAGLIEEMCEMMVTLGIPIACGPETLVGSNVTKELELHMNIITDLREEFVQLVTE